MFFKHVGVSRLKIRDELLRKDEGETCIGNSADHVDDVVFAEIHSAEPDSHRKYKDWERLQFLNF